MRTRVRPVGVGPVADVEIDGIAAGGDGVGRIEGMVVFVPRAAPGDRLAVRLSTRRGGRFARGEIVQIERPSSSRTEAPCPHYTDDRCGGCQLQHLTDEAQRSAKSTIVREALVRIGRRSVDAPVVVAADQPWRYRTKLTLAMRRRDGRWIAGLHPYDDPDAVFALDDCPITDDRVVAVWRDVMRAADLLPAAESLRGAVRVLPGGAPTLTIEGGAAWAEASEFFADVPVLAALWWRPDPLGSATRLMAARDEVAASVGASFAQVNPTVGRLLHSAVVQRAMIGAPATAIDAYAGLGDTAVALAAAGVRVTAIEWDRAAAEWCGGRLPDGSRAVAAKVEDVVAGLLPVDLVVLNPPRTGVAAAVAEALAGPRGPRRILYVSCDPATLARDLGRLEPYRVTGLEAFDMFPQTAHVETLCELERVA
jgi:23S rRNA (uracil1939-C5)-methyltransferase